MNTFFNIKVYHFLLDCMAGVATAATASGCQLERSSQMNWLARTCVQR